MTFAWRVLFLAFVTALLALTRKASAGPTRVALMRPSTASAAVTQALTRIQGELTADGFEVVWIDSETLDPAASIVDSGAQASIGLFVDTAARTAELRVVDRLTNKDVVRRTPIDETDSSKAAAVLAVRAVELLRASLLELMIRESASTETPAAAAPEVRQASKWAARGLRPERLSRWAVEAGAAVITSFDGIGPAVLSLLRGRFAFLPQLAVRATLAGLGTEPRIQAATGSALVAQDVGLVEIVARPWADATHATRTLLRPAFSLGAGALYTSVDGQAAFPYVPRRSSQWAVAADAGAGLEVAIGPRFAIALEIHALLAGPYPVVRFLGDEVARGGQPSVLGTLTLVGSP